MIRIMKYNEVANSEIFGRTEASMDISGIVADILANVRERGDAAIREYTERFDKVSLDDILVSKEEIDEAMALIDPQFIGVLNRAAANIRTFHEKQVRQGFEIRREDGCVIGQKITPVDKAGLYVPGGTAAYPSTVLMDSIRWQGSTGSSRSEAPRRSQLWLTEPKRSPKLTRS